MRARMIAACAALGMGCGSSTGGKAPVEDDFGDLEALLGDGAVAGKADHLEPMIVGSLSYGQQSSTVSYRNPPRYRVFKFAADAGDAIDVRVTSAWGDAVAWVLDDDLAVVGYNDDAGGGTLDSRVSVEIPPHPSRTHYVFFRDYDHLDATFRVRLDGVASAVECSRDSECEMVEIGCCNVGDWTAVPTSQVDAFEASKNCDPAQVCPLLPIVYRGEQAICDRQSRACEIVLPADLACGGFNTNPHFCPDGWVCRGDGLTFDQPGECLRSCGGPSSLPCPAGLTCSDDPVDSCTTAGCPGICS